MVALQLPRKCLFLFLAYNGQRVSDLTLIRVRCRFRSAWPVISPTRKRRSCLVSRKAKLAWPGLNSLSISLACLHPDASFHNSRPSYMFCWFFFSSPFICSHETATLADRLETFKAIGQGSCFMRTNKWRWRWKEKPVKHIRRPGSKLPV